MLEPIYCFYCTYFICKGFFVKLGNEINYYLDLGLLNVITSTITCWVIVNHLQLFEKKNLSLIKCSGVTNIYTSIHDQEKVLFFVKITFWQNYQDLPIKINNKYFKCRMTKKILLTSKITGICNPQFNYQTALFVVDFIFF